MKMQLNSHAQKLIEKLDLIHCKNCETAHIWGRLVQQPVSNYDFLTNFIDFQIYLTDLQLYSVEDI